MQEEHDMSDPSSAGPTPTGVDDPTDAPIRKPEANALDNPSGYSGQDYRREREAVEGRQRPSGHPLIGNPGTVTVPGADADGRNIPPENGRRGWVDPATGEVHGSGAGAGGGNPGEDFDDESPAGG
jgi:hypothetical protein